MRHTPAGIPVLSFQAEHQSQVTEAGQPREVNLVIDCVMIGDQANAIDALPEKTDLYLSGFVANRSKKSGWVVFHVNEFEEVIRS